jgi:hypothetical protein
MRFSANFFTASEPLSGTSLIAAEVAGGHPSTCVQLELHFFSLVCAHRGLLPAQAPLPSSWIFVSVAGQTLAIPSTETVPEHTTGQFTL